MKERKIVGLLTVMIAFSLSLVFPISSKASRTTEKFGLELKSLGDKKTAFDVTLCTY